MSSQGRDVLAEQERLVSLIVSASFEMQLGGAAGAAKGWGMCLAVHADRAPELRSHIGNALAAKSRDAGLRPIGAVLYVEPAMGDPSKVKVSLRSIGDEDTTVMSAFFGGGGHKNASSFIISRQSLDDWLL